MSQKKGVTAPRRVKVEAQQEAMHAGLEQAPVRMFRANERMNQLLIEHLDPAAWTAKPAGNVRTIAAVFTHMHNVRCKWVRLTAPHLGVPKQLNRWKCTMRQAQLGLAESAGRCDEMLAQALGGDERVRFFHRDALAPAWPVGEEMVYYMLAHEAHHRGQVILLAHQMGFKLPFEASDGIWNWEKLWRECGSETARPKRLRDAAEAER